MSIEQKVAFLKTMLPKVSWTGRSDPVTESLIQRLESEPPDRLFFR